MRELLLYSRNSKEMHFSFVIKNPSGSFESYYIGNHVSLYIANVIWMDRSRLLHDACTGQLSYDAFDVKKIYRHDYRLAYRSMGLLRLSQARPSQIGSKSNFNQLSLFT